MTAVASGLVGGGGSGGDVGTRRAAAPATCGTEEAELAAAGVALTQAQQAVEERRSRLKAKKKKVRQARARLTTAKVHPGASGPAVKKATKRLKSAQRKRRAARGRLVQARVAMTTAGTRSADALAGLQACTVRVAESNSTPRLVSAELQGTDQVLLTFNRPMGESAGAVAAYGSSPSLNVTGAALLPGFDRVLLSTDPLYAVPYRITLSTDVLDAGGEPIDPAHRTASVTGTIAVNALRPAVTSASSTGNRTVVVQFSKPMGDSAVRPGGYEVVLEPGSTGGVPVSAARFTDGSRQSVELTTGAQSEVDYRVRVGDVVDLTGLALAERSGSLGGPIDPTSAVFRGTPASASGLVDSDCDGLTDAEELRGYQIHVELGNGQAHTRVVTSNPGTVDADCAAPRPEHDLDGDDVLDSADTDGDGLGDAAEKSLGTDPRDSDTDDDGLTDDVEFNETYSDPTGQDTDGDSLTDGLEMSFFRTSAILADTDGDQIDDGTETSLATRRPRVSDLPQPALEIGEMRLDLDVRFIDRTGTESKQVDTEEVSTTLTQTDSKEFASTDSRTLEAGTKLSQTASFTIGYDSGPSAEATFSTTSEQSFNSTFLASFTETSKQETEQERAKTLTSEVEKADSADRTREVHGASVQTAVTLKTAGDIAFTIRNLQVVALIQDPQNPAKLTPVATLLPIQGSASEFNLGPLVPERGPVIFESTQVFPTLVDDLMRNPRGLVFKFSNYDTTDELGRNFAYTSQDINDRTAALTIDYGGFDADDDGVGDLTEKRRVATGTGRLVDTNADGVVDEGDRRAVFDPDGNSLGITLREALAAIGLEEYDETAHPTASLTQAEIDGSYSVIRRDDGGDRIFRVRRTGMEPGVAKQWEIITPTGIDQSLTLDSLIMDAGQSITLAFLADTDQDRLPALLESVHGCVDSPTDSDADGIADSTDTDGDGLDDRFEVLVGWKVESQRGSRNVQSRCTSEDTDNDRLTDDDEAPAAVERDDSGLIVIGTGRAPRRETTGLEDPLIGWALSDPITDPTSADTDADGLTDDYELTERRLPLVSPPATPGQMTELQATSPEHFDSDRDTASDGVEETVGGDPRVADFENFGDSDQDGVVNALEGIGYDVVTRGVSTGGTCDSVCADGATSTVSVTSERDVADTDGDGLNDGEERSLGTHPRSVDTDGDGLSDFEEARGFTLRDLGVVVTDPLDADSDDDKRSDGAEAGRGGGRLIIRVLGEAPYEAFTSPNDADQDLDQLVDGDEAVAGTNPGNFNTDGDNRSDYSEVRLGGRRPLVPDLRVRVNFNGLEIEEDGDGGSSAGDFEFAIGVRKPNGQLWCEHQTGCGAPEHMPFTSWTGGPFGIDLRDCDGNDLYDGVCRWSPRRINFQSGYRVAGLDNEIVVGSVSTSDIELESFSLTGFLREYEGDDVDCSTVYPNPQYEDHSGTIRGTDLTAGTTLMNITRNFGCSTGGDNKVESKLLVSYTAD
ncbi:hypothetical protein RB608_13055 [Nocardioides sp. LHD-245]|uniref:hypothetical protein n=1 Tax=Nocardioides sp. LHD-245 TaxID=3051387 RepID=UPI0027DFCAE7|nr:hypothetical protein [Nocardioides sp. LHD-245]